MRHLGKINNNWFSSYIVAQGQIKFKDVFPVSISAVPFDATQEQQQYYTATASFRYTIFDVIDVNGKKV